MSEKAGISWVQVVGAALAAVSSAVLMSTLGVAGTIIGAAAGSVVISVGGALYSRGIAASQQQLATQAAALRRAAQARSTRGPQGTAVLDPVLDLGADPVDGPVDDTEIADGAGEVPEEPTRALPWKRIAILAAALFAAVMLVITGFELLTGKPVSSYTGGSDDTGTTLFERQPEQPTRMPSPSPSDGTSGQPTSTQTPTGEPTDQPTGTGTPTDTPTGTPTPSDTPGQPGDQPSDPASGQPGGPADTTG